MFIGFLGFTQNPDIDGFRTVGENFLESENSDKNSKNSDIVNAVNHIRDTTATSTYVEWKYIDTLLAFIRTHNVLFDTYQQYINVKDE
jgi:hypothetical protein